jgi:hypothetical protein
VRIELRDDCGFNHVIDSADYDLIGRWFAEKSKLFASADTRVNHPAHMHIWPSGASFDADQAAMKASRVPVQSVEGLHALITGLLELSAAWQEAEAA